jgi:hypothetical protein
MRTPAISESRRRGSESGYALLFVFVLAATVAVSLYYELPRIMFERTREREQLLIDRGEQYSLAIRRFYVKFGRWPASMDELENTNNIRFLRRQYKDPMTGKADWRIIHEAAGVLTDSLVHPANPLQGQNGVNGTGGVGAANGVGGTSGTNGTTSSNSSPFNQSFGTLTSSNPTGSSMTASAAGLTPEQPAPKAWGMSFRPSDRGPTGKAHGGVSANDDMMTDSGAGGDQSYVSAPDSGGANPAMPANPNPPPSDASNANAPAGTGSPNGGQPAISPNQTAGAGGAGEAGPAGPNAAIAAIQQSLTSPRQVPTPGTGGTGGNASSPLSSGGIGIAGVASTSEMQGIKRYKDRSKYKEWEFVFDMSSLQQIQNPQQQQQQQQQGQAGQNGQIGQPSTPTAPQQPPPGLGGITQPPSGNGP